MDEDIATDSFTCLTIRYATDHATRSATVDAIRIDVNDTRYVIRNVTHSATRNIIDSVIDDLLKEVR